MKTDLLASRHIGINEQDTALMLRKIGVNSLDELIDKTIPANIRLKEPLALTSPLTEYEFGKHIAELANKNKLYTTYIGLGWYNTITPAVIQRNVFENPVWYTSYTPYQTEVSQGRLEALMNFQTAVCDLTAMPLANCSLLDEATAAAEAVSMMYAIRSRAQQKANANVVFVDENIFPQTLAVMTTRAVPQGIELRVGKYKDFGLNNNEVLWNAQISKNFLKNNSGTIRFKIYDILKQQSSLSRSISETMMSDTEYNTLGSYFMVHFVYRFNTLGGKSGNRHGFGGGPRREHGFGGGGRPMRF